jgi:hypothetical protein
LTADNGGSAAGFLEAGFDDREVPDAVGDSLLAICGWWASPASGLCVPSEPIVNAQTSCLVNCLASVVLKLSGDDIAELVRCGKEESLRPPEL